MIRSLPHTQPRWSGDAEVVVAGSGAAGMTAALTAAAHGRRVLLLSKDDLGGGSTPLAQGGMAAVLEPSDSPALHVADTMTAGAGLGDRAAVEALVTAAPGVIGWLETLGARLATAPLHLEGGHSRRRIVHAGGDAIGAEVHRVLAAAVRAAKGVQVLPRAVALDLADGGLIVGRDRVPGARLLEPGFVSARTIVLATGGFGQAYATTTNPAGVTGDGLALAARAGAELRDLEFVQFHPTVLWSADAAGRCPLITEALRGAGAVLVDGSGRRVMPGRHHLADLAPRDVVAAAMHARMAETGEAHLWLDATMAGRTVLEKSFPTVTAACREHGVDPVTDLIPVAPGAHYACGGIRADMDGRTSVPGLFAVGEAACTGVHGANRLASNSLTEAITMGRRLGDLLGAELPERVAPPPESRRTAAGNAADGVYGRAAGLAGVDPDARRAMAEAMSRYAGVVRDRTGLESLLRLLGAVPAPDGALTLAAVEATSLHTVSLLVAAAALKREQSAGCHRRLEQAEPDQARQKGMAA